MISKIWLKERTEDSIPFMSAEKKCHLKQLGYVEEEYFISGTANVYDSGDDHVAYKIYSDAPYTNRIMIRRPADFKDFSGNVVVEILNASATIDLDRMWVNAWRFFTRNGDIYIGLTSKSDVVPALYQFDPERYKEINWSNPMPERQQPENLEEFRFGFYPQFEYGLFWDMLGDLGKLLKNQVPDNPLKGYGDYKVYLTGWSQSTWYVMRWLKSFAYLPENYDKGPLFAGYLSAGGSFHPASINTYHPVKANVFGNMGVNEMGAKEPLIAVNTESENAHVNWSGDSDTPGYLFRTYEFAGSTHDTKNNIVDWYKDDEDLKRLGWEMRFEGVDGEPNDYPYEVLFQAAFNNLYQWVRNGVPAPHGEKIPRNSRRENMTDAFGNALGGVRTAAINYPTCRYYITSKKADGSINPLFGHIRVFSPQMLKELYGNAENYEQLVREDCRVQVAKGFMLKEDVEWFVNELVQTAKARGL